jgi:hypothetical protein
MSETRIWSDEQNNIFNWFKSGRGHLVVQARAGTGKTSTIIEAFGHAPEDKICYCVFNKKNQLEAQGKVTDGRVEVKTLHALGYAFIRNIWKGVSPLCSCRTRLSPRSPSSSASPRTSPSIPRWKTS